MAKGVKKKYVMLINVHGLIRGSSLELGRDADNGGQTKYVVELTRALSLHASVERVDLVTRLVRAPDVHSDYSKSIERINDSANIIRLNCGPDAYIRKELLWPYLESFADQILQYIRSQNREPDVIHCHYADSGYVGTCITRLLDIPLIFTGHSLGRVKRMRLGAQGISSDFIESQYHITQRIEAEEVILDNATQIIASTKQEVGQQYSLYDNYEPCMMSVLPPGVDLDRFYSSLQLKEKKPAFFSEIKRFLSHPNKPMILAISRADVRKNIATLVKAFGENQELRNKANLVIIAGCRTDLRDMEDGPKNVLKELLLQIDFYDLYGVVAYPKQHQPNDIPGLYRLAASTGGVFVNPALTEPFGLTLLEAAASGLPIFATEDGGPRDIINDCNNGVVFDPLNAKKLGEILLSAISNQSRWSKWSKAGLAGIKRSYSWQSHVDSYLKGVARFSNKKRKRYRTSVSLLKKFKGIDRLLICDIDNTLIGEKASLKRLLTLLQNYKGHLAFGIATGRHIDSAKKVLKAWKVPTPDVFITSVGSEIHMGSALPQDMAWFKHIDHRWEPNAIKAAMKNLLGLKLQKKSSQRPHKVSYDIDPKLAPSIRDIVRHLRRLNLHANVIYSHQSYLDILPVRASKGAALRFFADNCDIPISRVLVCGDSGNDEEMLKGDTLGVVVGNHSAELEHLKFNDHMFFAKGSYAEGIIEGIEHFDFLGNFRIKVQKHDRRRAK